MKKPSSATTPEVSGLPSSQSQAKDRNKLNTNVSGNKQPGIKKIPWRLWVVVVVGMVWLGFGMYFLLLSGPDSQSEPKPIASIKAPDYHSLAFNPARPEIIYFGSHAGLMKSEDSGQTWQAGNLQNQDAMNISLAKNSPLAYIGGHDVFFKSEDSGQTWRSLLQRLPATDIHALALDPTNSNRLYAYAVGLGLLKSEDGAQNWQLVSRKLGDSTTGLAFDGKTLWAATLERGVLRSQDNGATWELASGFVNGALDNSARVNSLAFDIQTNRLYAGTSQGLYQTQDGGASWTRSGYGGVVAAAAVNPVNSKMLLVINPKGEVYRSQDGGLSWAGK